MIPEDKADERIAVTTQGRNSKPVDMVIEQVDRTVWVNHGSSAKIAEELRLEKVREKLTERQEVVLSFVEKRRKDDGIFINSNDLILHLNDEFKGDKTKA